MEQIKIEKYKNGMYNVNQSGRINRKEKKGDGETDRLAKV
jgi:hypothetical protein